MSLVINSNDNQTQEISNSWIDYYPDIRQILLQPDRDIAIEQNKTGQNDSTIAWNIRGLNINAFQVNFITPDVLIWNPYNSYAWLWSQYTIRFWYYQEVNTNATLTVSNKEQYVILAVSWEISWWQVIWKRIRLNPDSLSFWWYVNWNHSYSWNNSFRLQLWLLHKDWTITYWTLHEVWTDSWSGSSSAWQWNKDTAYKTYAGWMITIEDNNWLTTQDWDVVIVKLISHTTSYSQNHTNTYTTWNWVYTTIKFWNQWWWVWARPIEISLN